MRIASLGSGSRGNATLLEADGTLVMVDCGFPLREIKRRAARLDIDLAALDAVFITHEHSDHCSGATALARHYRVPVYLTHGTFASGRLDKCPELRCFDADAEFAVGALSVQSVTVPHDAREPVQYCFSADGQRIGVLTDLGSITSHVCEAFHSCDALLLEFNHDRRMLAEGPYPPALKRRVGGDWGHLSNCQAVELLSQLNAGRLQRLMIAHVSEKNNERGCVEELIEERFPDMLPRTVWASQESGFAWVSLGCDVAASAGASEIGQSLEPAVAIRAY